MTGSGPLSGSYDASDVAFLLKPITQPTIDIAEKERRIQSGSFHYSQMLSPEHAPDADYMAAYHQALADNGATLAGHINLLADAIIARGWAPSGKRIALASLARAGTPIGVLLARALRRRGIGTDHYSISIIRGRGIDHNALRHILQRHDAGDVIFLDGWTGKGAIAQELRGPDGPSAVGIAPRLVVVADPAGVADLAATAQDYVIPSGILNGIVSGLVSRSVLNEQIGAGDFHGCVILEHLAPHDVSRAFVDHIDALAIAGEQLPNTQTLSGEARASLRQACETLLAFIQHHYHVADRNRIKPGIAEATRAVLRRVPDRLLVCDEDEAAVRHLVLLARQKGVIIARLPALSGYRAVAIIAAMGDE